MSDDYWDDYRFEPSPIKSDGGHPVGRNPKEIDVERLRLDYTTGTVKAIREKCLDCCVGQIDEVRKCVSIKCALWPFRMGKNVFDTRRQTLKGVPLKGIKSRMVKDELNEEG